MSVVLNIVYDKSNYQYRNYIFPYEGQAFVRYYEE